MTRSIGSCMNACTTPTFCLLPFDMSPILRPRSRSNLRASPSTRAEQSTRRMRAMNPR